jgi:CheY-like chemotaxis protein
VQAIQTLIADDTALLRRLLVDRLGREGDIYIVAEAGDGREAVEMARETSPDVAILDFDMPNLNGIQAAQKIVAERPVRRRGAADRPRAPGHAGRAVRGLRVPRQGLFAAGTGRRRPPRVRRGPGAAAGPGDAARTGGRSLTEKVERLAARSGLTDRERAVVVRMVTTEMTAAQVARSLTARAPPRPKRRQAHLGRAIQKLGIEPRTRAALIRRVLDT